MHAAATLAVLPAWMPHTFLEARARLVPAPRMHSPGISPPRPRHRAQITDRGSPGERSDVLSAGNRGALPAVDLDGPLLAGGGRAHGVKGVLADALEAVVARLGDRVDAVTTAPEAAGALTPLGHVARRTVVALVALGDGAVVLCMVVPLLLLACLVMDCDGVAGREMQSRLTRAALGRPLRDSRQRFSLCTQNQPVRHRHGTFAWWLGILTSGTSDFPTTPPRASLNCPPRKSITVCL